jgi:peptide-methionine (S)-S-oxide reductase
MRSHMKIILSAVAATAALGITLYAAGVQAPAPAVAAATTIPAPAADIKEAGREAVAVFAGGCFWGVEGVFEHVAGVKRSNPAMRAAARATPITTRSAAGGPSMPRRCGSSTIPAR